MKCGSSVSPLWEHPQETVNKTAFPGCSQEPPALRGDTRSERVSCTKLRAQPDGSVHLGTCRGMGVSRTSLHLMIQKFLAPYVLCAQSEMYFNQSPDPSLALPCARHGCT